MLDHVKSMMLIREFATGESPVINVEYLMDPDLPKRPVAIRISFVASSLYLIARGEDDSIDVAKEASEELARDTAATNVSLNDPWRSVIGTKLMWGWILTNHQGYTDGVQLEFKGESPNHTPCIQGIVIASTIEVRTVLLSSALPATKATTSSGS